MDSKLPSRSRTLHFGEGIARVATLIALGVSGLVGCAGATNHQASSGPPTEYATPVELSLPPSSAGTLGPIVDNEWTDQLVANASSNTAWYWSSPTATPTELPGDASGEWVYAEGFGMVNGALNVCGSTVISSGGTYNAGAALWADPTKPPSQYLARNTALRGPIYETEATGGNSTGQFSGYDDAIGGYRPVYWSAAGIETPLAPTGSDAISDTGGTGNGPVIATLGSAASGNTPAVDLSPTAGAAHHLPGGSARVSTAMNLSGIVVGYDKGASGQLEAVFWTPYDHYSVEHVLPSPPNTKKITALGIASNGWMVGSVEYNDSTTGVPLWKTTVGVDDVATKIPANSGWKLASSSCILPDGSIIAQGHRGPSGTVNVYIHMNG